MESRGIWVLAILMLLQGCAFTPIYTSQDLARLPCESTASKFFYPVEFDVDGRLLYENQLKAAQTAASTVKDIIIFVHGWDKTTGSAEKDYQDFLCRLYWRGVDSDYLKENQAVVIGVFWPSTIFRNYEDFPLIKPFTYYVIKDRADQLMKEGIRKRLLPEILDSVDHHAEKRLHIVGHSFGARMLIWAASDYFGTIIHRKAQTTYSAVNFVLLLPAIEPERGQLALAQAIMLLDEGLAQVEVDPAGPRRYLKAAHLRVFVVHSERDWANYFLFPISEALSLRMPYCSIGACGEPSAPTITVNESGEFSEWMTYSGRVWNVQADSIISSHSDIYKGRVADLIWRLINTKELPRSIQEGPLKLFLERPTAH